MRSVHIVFFILLTSCSGIKKKYFQKYRSIASESTKLQCTDTPLQFPKLKKYQLAKISTESALDFDQEIHVTQFLYGLPGVINRKKELMARDFEDLNEYIVTRPIPYVRGPDGLKYIIDRHHFSRSLFELKEDFIAKFGERAQDIRVHFQEVVFDDFDPINMTEDEFSQLMIDNKLTFLKKDGVNRSFSELPREIDKLEADYYRGLSWLVRKSGAYKKTDIPFAEFYWGDFLKNKLKLDKEDKNFSKKIIKKAIKAALTFDDGNRHLPGFDGTKNIDSDEFKEKIKKAMKKLKKKGLLNLDNTTQLD